MNFRKLTLSIASVAIVAAPIATVIACGTSSVGVKVNGYEDAMIQLGSGKITLAGAWADARFMAGANRDKLEAVGVESNKIANDGIQVKSSMKAGDMFALQTMFRALIVEANAQKEDYDTNGGTPGPLLIDFENDGNYTTIFDLYSHNEYASLDSSTKVPYLENGDIVEKDAMGTSPSDSDGDYFSSGTSSGDITLETGNAWETIGSSELKVVFIPSKSPDSAASVTAKLQSYLQARGINASITTSADYNSAATSLEAGSIDIAFLPVDTWALQAPSSMFILQAARPRQVATLKLSTTGSIAEIDNLIINDEILATKAMNAFSQLYLDDLPLAGAPDNAWAGTNANRLEFVAAFEDNTSDLHDLATQAVNLRQDIGYDNEVRLAPSYESFMYANNTSDIFATISGVNTTEDWRLVWDDVKSNIIYGYTSKTSAASYLFPELWFRTYFTGFNGL